MKKLFLVLIIVISPKTCATPSQQAVSTAAQAFYQYEHWNEDVNEFLKHYEQKLTPQQREVGTIMGIIANAIIKKEISITIRF